jgi:hypothetical protein
VAPVGTAGVTCLAIRDGTERASLLMRQAPLAERPAPVASEIATPLLYRDQARISRLAIRQPFSCSAIALFSTTASAPLTFDMLSVTACDH